MKRKTAVLLFFFIGVALLADVRVSMALLRDKKHPAQGRVF